jgi:hypothetical protein
MAVVFVIEDEFHAEWISQFDSFEAAMNELRRLATIPWGQRPNRAPCTSGDACKREYQIIEVDDSEASSEPRGPTLTISAKSVQWLNPD